MCYILCETFRMHAQIVYSLSERHMLLDEPIDINSMSTTSVAPCLLQALCLVVEHAARLPCLHSQQASSGDTALLMVGPCLICGSSIPDHTRQSSSHQLMIASAYATIQPVAQNICMAGKPELLGVCAWQAPSLAVMVGVTGYSIWRGTNLGRELLKVVSDAPFRTLCAESLSASVDGRLPGNLGDAPETMETGRGTG